MGRARLQAADTYMQEISEPVKPIKVGKTQVAKKVGERNDGGGGAHCTTIRGVRGHLEEQKAW